VFQDSNKAPAVLPADSKQGPSVVEDETSMAKEGPLSDDEGEIGL